jgi:hypothetical protein
MGANPQPNQLGSFATAAALFALSCELDSWLFLRG